MILNRSQKERSVKPSISEKMVAHKIPKSLNIRAKLIALSLSS